MAKEIAVVTLNVHLTRCQKRHLESILSFYNVHKKQAEREGFSFLGATEEFSEVLYKTLFYGNS